MVIFLWKCTLCVKIEHCNQPKRKPTHAMLWIFLAILRSSFPKLPGGNESAECWMHRQSRYAGVSLWSSPLGSISVSTRFTSASSWARSNSSASFLFFGPFALFELCRNPAHSRGAAPHVGHASTFLAPRVRRRVRVWPGSGLALSGSLYRKI